MVASAPQMFMQAEARTKRDVCDDAWSLIEAVMEQNCWGQAIGSCQWRKRSNERILTTLFSECLINYIFKDD